MEMDTIVQIIGSLGAVLVAIHQVVKAFEKPRPRQALLEDLEILSKTPESLPEKELLLLHVKKSYKTLYTANLKRKRDWSMIIIMPLFAVGLANWTYQLSKDEFSYWSILTALFAIGAVGSWIDELKGSENKNDKKTEKIPNN